MSRNRPNIGVTGPDEGGTAAWWFTKLAVWLQGGRAIRLRPGRDDYSMDFHGLIIGGGADINPERYGETRFRDILKGNRKPSGFRQWLRRIATILFFPFILVLRKVMSTKSSAVDERRDKLEFRLLEQAIHKELPVLGICRGAQLINIRFGGSLYQDITGFYSEVPQIYSIWPKKTVTIDEESRLFEILQFRRVWINALHNQAVKTVGKQLKVVAREDTGIAQAIEHEEYPFMIGVQWHPEYLPQLPAQRRIFKALVDEAKSILKSG